MLVLHGLHETEIDQILTEIVANATEIAEIQATAISLA